MVAGLTVVSKTKISKTEGGLFSGTLAAGDRFGYSVSDVGDLDGDGTLDIVAGSVIRDAVHVLFLNNDGTVKGAKTISRPDLNSGVISRFGASVSGVGDLNKDTTLDIVVGAYGGTQIPDLVVFFSSLSLPFSSLAFSPI
jgi:hypothetical protein